MTFWVFLTVYVLGGLTFIPLVLAAVFCHAYITLPAGHDTSTADDCLSSDPDSNDLHRELPDVGLEHLPDELKPRSHVPDVAAGYFAVCREYVPGGINGKPPERTTPAGAVVAVESPSVYQSMYRSIFDRNKTLTPTLDGGNGKSKKARNVFYVVLRHGHLMLYDDSEQLEVRHVISLAHYEVDIYAGGEDVPEGELWIKRNCIRLTQRMSLEAIAPDSKPFFFFSENCSEKEDFYHAMLQNQERRTESLGSPPIPLLFNTSDLVKLVQQLHTSEENLQTRWINALIGRLFLGLYKTSEVENFIRTKITKKIARVPKPALISSITLRKIDMGNLPPFITNPKLKELTVDGDLTVEADVKYKGNFRLEISAIARIELGSRFKAREVTLILAGILKKLEGHVLVRIKPPPSNRLWMTFESAPKMELSLEPIVSSRQITYGVILRAIESRIREVVSDTLVLPNWDDIPFSDTILQRFRGGIWVDGVKDGATTTYGRETAGQDIYHDENGADSDDSELPQASHLITNEKAKSMLGLRATTTNTQKPTGSSIDSEDTDESVGISSATDLRPLAKPKAMRSGSFAGGEMRTSQQDAASAMKTITKSQPTSPVDTPIGSLSQPSLINLSEASDAASPTIALSAEQSTQDPDPVISPTTVPRASTTTSQSRHTSSLSLPRNAFSSAERRQTFNQSLNSATAAAKKWFASRQNSESSSPPMSEGVLPTPQSSKSRVPFSGNVKERSEVSAEGSSSQFPSTSSPDSPLGSPAHPIGRGQPLPPPGTPLPLPPKPEKRNTGWGVPSASSFANLIERKPISIKQPPPADSTETPRKQPAFTNTPTKPQFPNNETVTTSEKVSTHSRRKSSSGMLPPLPPRRQRLSVTEPAAQSPKLGEELLVVEAPLADVSAPTSPLEEMPSARTESDGDFGAWNGHDEQENTDTAADPDRIFEGMNMDSGVT
ncbi:hypothetical protein K469DRAFT_679023 [Zopfia rhizophila CBS 207.26]|uniref:SMP-LTD domain-containing protein n=1 Tax=Zopfia rhizophila CBS 207.26 TaxID=1314779 RepID=A0A6A6DCJ3_9PEZI|nr:hypothetical protein K469DRAFT_679023 [Zopfia rhizophila CBS 207.26]